MSAAPDRNAGPVDRRAPRRRALTRRPLRPRHVLRGASALIVLSIVASSFAVAQLRHVPLDARIDGATAIVEGRVVESVPFMNAEGTLIHTAHSIEAYKVLKRGAAGYGDLARIELITPGGRLGDRWHVVQPSLELAPGDAGLFLVDARARHAGREGVFVPHAGALAFLRYRPDGSAADPFERFADVEAELYARIAWRTGESLLTLRPGSVALGDDGGGAGPASFGEDPGPATTFGGGGSAGPSISALAPATARAGVQDVLTISGSGFGSLSGAATVLFDDAIDGRDGIFKPVDPEHILSWSDTEIQVCVPNLTGGKVTAGTGRVIVRDAAGAEGASPQDLVVDYALNEILSFGAVQRVHQIDQNGMGGYTLTYSTGTANGGVDFTSIPGAVARFEDAVEQWRCSTGWNVEVDGTTAVAAVGDDGINVVTFDNDADPLPAGALARATSYFQGCSGDTWRVIGMDIRFRRDGTGGADWYFGADPAGQGPGEDDFETVALHELGHNLQHDHINDPLDPMYFSISTGSNKRVLSQADISGAADIIDHSSGFVACLDTGMQAFDCGAPPTADFYGSPRGSCASSLTVDFTDMSQNGPTAWSWSFGDTATASARHPAHTYASHGVFAVSLESSNLNGSDMTTKSAYVVLSPAPAAASCTPTFAGHNSCCGIGIKNVSLGSIDRTTGTSTDGDPRQEDFTCSDFGLLQAGASVPISVRTGSGNNEDVKVYVDWDGDGVLEPGELAFVSDNAQPLHTGTISVPETAVHDTALRMRVLSDFASQNIYSPCENIEYGQVEDYSVIVSADAPSGGPGAVPAASLVLAKGTDPALIDASWSASCGAGASDYTIHEGTLGAFYSHASVVCSTGGATSYSGLSLGTGNRYVLVTPVSATAEGSYGRDSAASERPVSTATCIATQELGACP